MNHLIALLSYPDHVFRANLSIARTIEVNALKGTYAYSSGTIITIRNPISTLTSTVKGLTDTAVKGYVSNVLILYADGVFSNSVYEVFLAR